MHNLGARQSPCHGRLQCRRRGWYGGGGLIIVDLWGDRWVVAHGVVKGRSSDVRFQSTGVPTAREKRSRRPHKA
eukprot:3885243-Prymnesium_polylepis.2